MFCASYLFQSQIKAKTLETLLMPALVFAFSTVIASLHYHRCWKSISKQKQRLFLILIRCIFASLPFLECAYAIAVQWCALFDALNRRRQMRYRQITRQITRFRRVLRFCWLPRHRNHHALQPIFLLVTAVVHFLTGSTKPNTETHHHNRQRTRLQRKLHNLWRVRETRRRLRVSCLRLSCGSQCLSLSLTPRWVASFCRKSKRWVASFCCNCSRRLPRRHRHHCAAAWPLTVRFYRESRAFYRVCARPQRVSRLSATHCGLLSLSRCQRSKFTLIAVVKWLSCGLGFDFDATKGYEGEGPSQQVSACCVRLFVCGVLIYFAPGRR